MSALLKINHTIGKQVFVIKEVPLLPKDSIINLRPGSLLIELLANVQRETQYRFIWTATLDIISDYIIELINKGALPQHAMNVGMADGIIAVQNDNPHMRSYEHFIRTVNRNPVQLIVTEPGPINGTDQIH